VNLTCISEVYVMTLTPSMASVNLVVIVESIRTLTSHTRGELNKLHIPSLVSVAAALGVYNQIQT
jgi:hypothetical protein